MRIAIIDDDRTNLELFRNMVRKVGPHETVVFDDPHAALRFLKDQSVDLVVLDLMMPDIDGIEILQEIRRSEHINDVPVIMATANGDEKTKEEALTKGATDFLTKPVGYVEFCTRVRNLLSLRESRNLLADRAVHLAQEVNRAMAGIIERERELLSRLCRAAEFRDPETGAHIERMSRFSKVIAESLGLDDAMVDLILESAPLHDIGKIGIPDHILLKPGKLTDEEMTIMRTHALIGHSILKGSKIEAIRLGADIALSHHEKWDGTGYPNRLAGEDIPLVGRIVAVADVFDALTSVRPYKRAWPIDEARAFMIDQIGKHFDPQCMAAFLARWDDILDIMQSVKDEDSTSPEQGRGG